MRSAQALRPLERTALLELTEARIAQVSPNVVLSVGAHTVDVAAGHAHHLLRMGRGPWRS